MKNLLLLIAVHALCSSRSLGQPPKFHDLRHRHTSLSPLTVTGITLTGAGVFPLVFGGFYYLTNGDTGGRGSNSTGPTHQDNTGPVMMEIGGGMVLVGCMLMAAGFEHTRQQKAKRLSVVAPKRNQLGLAYNF